MLSGPWGEGVLSKQDMLSLGLEGLVRDCSGGPAIQSHARLVRPIALFPSGQLLCPDGGRDVLDHG